MFTVTDKAMKKLTENLKEMKVAKNESFRMDRSKEDMMKLRLSIHRINKTDHIIKNKEKRIVLVIEAGLFPQLDRVGFDYIKEAFEIVDLKK